MCRWERPPRSIWRAPSSALSCFGYATDLLGRKKLFTITLLVYLLWNVSLGVRLEFSQLFVFPVCYGNGDWRRVCGDQFGNRRTHPGPGTRSRQSDCQCDLLAGSRPWRGGHHLSPGRALYAGSLRVAARLRHRSLTRYGHHICTEIHLRESTMARDSWETRRSRAHRWRD